MKTYIIASAVGKDRPGLVNAVTHQVHELGGNIEMQRSTRMADEYALIVLFSLPGDAPDLQALTEQLRAAAGEEILVNAREAVSIPEQRAADAQGAVLEASGADQPGIIDAVTLLLFQHHINIESLDYDTDSAPMTGAPLFRLTASLAIPADTDLKALRTQLRDLEDEYNFDILLRCPA